MKRRRAKRKARSAGSDAPRTKRRAKGPALAVAGRPGGPKRTGVQTNLCSWGRGCGPHPPLTPRRWLCGQEMEHGAPAGGRAGEGERWRGRRRDVRSVPVLAARISSRFQDVVVPLDVGADSWWEVRGVQGAVGRGRTWSWSIGCACQPTAEAMNFWFVVALPVLGTVPIVRGWLKGRGRGRASRGHVFRS